MLNRNKQVYLGCCNQLQFGSFSNKLSENIVIDDAFDQKYNIIVFDIQYKAHKMLLS